MIQNHYNASPCGASRIRVYGFLALLAPAFVMQAAQVATQQPLPTPSTPALALPLGMPTEMPNPTEIIRQKRLWVAEASGKLTEQIERFRVELSSLQSVVQNPKIISSPEARQKITEWILSITEQVFAIAEKLRSKQIPSLALLKESAASLSLYIDMLYDALIKQLPNNLLEATVTQKEHIKAKLQAATAFVENKITQELKEQRAKLTPEQQKMLPEKIEPEFVDILLIEQFLNAMNEGLDHLATLIQDYGITKVNRAARTVDWLAKRAANHSLLPYFTVPAFFTGISIIARLLLIPESGYGKYPMLADVLRGGISAALSQFGGDVWNKAWTPVKRHMDELSNRWATWWKKCQGLPVKEKINGFEIIKPEDCEAPEEPLIGLEAQFNRVMASIESALNRIQAGEREPLKGVQRTFVFIAPAGMGKTYLMEQVKRRIAQLNQFGVEMAFESVEGEKLVFGDLMARIKEAQQNNIGLVLWIDEMHLYKPMKDGHTPLLSQLLRTEAVNKSNVPVWIFTATNEPGRFDNALIRAGRFEIINIYAPTFKDRVRLFDYYLRQQGMVLSAADLKVFASQTLGASPAMIRKVINSARASGKALTKELIQIEIFKSVFKFTSGFDSLNKREQREIAVYQSGKLLVHVLNTLEYEQDAQKRFMNGELFALGTVSGIERDPIELAGMVLESRAVNPNLDKSGRRTFGTFFSYTGRENAVGSHASSRDKQMRIYELVAGSVAQEAFLKDAVDDLRKEDIIKAFEYCTDIARDGIPLEMMSKKDQEACKKRALEIFTAAKHHAQTLIEQHKPLCQTMYEFMLQGQEYPHITGREVVILLNKQTEQAKSTTQEQAPSAPETQPVVLA